MKAVQGAVDVLLQTYDPKHDYYKQIREALTKSVAAGSDDPVKLAAQNAAPKKRGHYERIATGWMSWSARKEARIVHQPARWSLGQLDISLTPLLEIPRGRDAVLVVPYLKTAELDRQAARAIAHIMAAAYQFPPGMAGLLDVRRAKLIRGTARHEQNYDAWLESEGAAFAALFDRLYRAAS